MNNWHSEETKQYAQYTGLQLHKIRLNKAVRKDFVCFNCGGAIRKGSPSARYVGLCEGKFYCYHNCMQCYKEMQE